jgi:Kef-type K+ transport system membrane component KefB
MVLEVGLLLDIAILLLTAKVLGEISERLGFSSLIGEVVAGMILGPVLLIVHPHQFLEQLSMFGLLFLLFLIGLDTRFEDVKKDVYKGSVLAVIGSGFSFIAGFLVGTLVFNSAQVGIFLGVAMVSTSTAITFRALIDIGEMKTRIYEMTLAMNMADDVIAILGLSLLTTYDILHVRHGADLDGGRAVLRRHRVFPAHHKRRRQNRCEVP